MPDGSTAQWGYFNDASGAFIGHAKKQGQTADSAWSRGQAWAIYAYTAAYRETGNASFLSTAKKVSEFYIANMPSDGVPFWDFRATDIPNTYRDTSAAAGSGSHRPDEPLLEGRLGDPGQRPVDLAAGPLVVLVVAICAAATIQGRQHYQRCTPPCLDLH